MFSLHPGAVGVGGDEVVVAYRDADAYLHCRLFKE